MINDSTILSSFNDRPTLLEWLKKVEEALKSDTATGVSVENPSVNSYIFKITFADGKTIASDTIKFPDSVKGVSISNNHLIITTQGGIREDLGVINPYADTIVLNSGTNTTEIVNNVEIGGNLQVNSNAELRGNLLFGGSTISIQGTTKQNSVLGTNAVGQIAFKEISGGSQWYKHVITLRDGVNMKLLTILKDSFQNGEIVDGHYPAILLDIVGSAVPQAEYSFPVLIKQGNKFKIGYINSSNQRTLYTFDKTLIAEEEITAV